MLRKVLLTKKEIESRSLGLNWEGPYKVTKIIPREANELEDMEGRPLLHP